MTHMHSYIYGVPEGYDALVLANRAHRVAMSDGIVMHVALDDAEAERIAAALELFCPDGEVAVFPAWDCLPYDRVSPHSEIVGQRIRTLMTVQRWQGEKKRYPRILITTVNAALQRVLPRDVLSVAGFQAQKGGRLDIKSLEQFLVTNGYTRTDTVREAGEFAVRGGIIDLFPASADWPVRIDLFGDEIESLRRFDPESQRTTDKVDHISLMPAAEVFLDEASIARFRKGYREIFGVIRDDDPLYAAISEGRWYSGAEHWMPLFHERLETLFDYVPDADVSLGPHVLQAAESRLAQIEDFYETRHAMLNVKGREQGAPYRPLPPDQLYITQGAIFENAVIFQGFGGPDQPGTQDQGGRRGRDFGDIRALPDGDVLGAAKDHILALQGEKGRKVLIAAYSTGARERLQGMLAHAGLTRMKICDSLKEIKKLDPGFAGLIILPLEKGFVAPDTAILTEQDILGDRLTRKSKKSSKAENFLREVSALTPGDLVVHIEHGIGKFEGLETIRAAGAAHDCLRLIYAGDDRLFVPVENIDVLSRFGGESAIVQLDKLGGAGWQARKAKVKKDLMVMAGQLLELAAARQLQKAERLPIDTGIYDEFAARFPYTETEDQLRAIHDVLGDLEKDQPMDRLVCGDVGFGKTEVALRAAYVAAMGGVQVALVVPTTLLARQHFQNFIARFIGMGIRVQQLSRLVTAKDARLIREELEAGSVHIVIGTHALLSDKVKFKNLGLVIVDEEQRFGVKQKEKLKNFKQNVHVLTLTATPIPRTLQMSLSGVRDLSLITTPPVDRLAIRTFVMPYDPVVLREALMREHFRGGQSFYVCPRVADLDELQERLQDLVPELKVITAHGQLSATELEDRMSAFYDRQYDILLATNIIESGIDIPTANTMIVHRAEMFGLSQLYQIRGRIGRGKLRAYAYLTYDSKKKLNDMAQRRLEVIETLDQLGGGFQLASHDMDIRGAGNLLGDAQSGHVREVGVELYQQMLEEAVAEARAGGQGGDTDMPERFSPQISTGASVLIPETYVTDLNVRMSLYRRLSDLENKDELESFAAELIDRFGDIPDEVHNLLEIMEIKLLCRKAGVDKVEAGPKGAVISFFKNAPPNPDKLFVWLQERRGAVKLRPDQKLVVVKQWDKPAQRGKGVKSIISELAKCAA